MHDVKTYDVYVKNVMPQSTRWGGGGGIYDKESNFDQFSYHLIDLKGKSVSSFIVPCYCQCIYQLH